MQRTLASPAVVAGRGYWSGRKVTVTLRPAPANHGIIFVRTDLPGQPTVALDVHARADIPRRTCLHAGGVRVDMVEHLVAALSGLGIDQCSVELDSQEMPGCDGSSQWFVEAILDVGIVSLDAPRSVGRVDKVIRVGDDHAWLEARPVANDRLCLRYELSFDEAGPIGDQYLEYQHSYDAFRRELAPARTFLLESEAKLLRSQGLGKDVSTSELLVFSAAGPIDNPLRFVDECVRHKMLDLLGDLALAGCDWIGEIVSFRSGHRLNAQLVKALLASDQHRNQQHNACA
ncbi:MAG TPA: UDP-3-O-[3-hydroxymyristoyl] N-acetylglucosamine deacetylase [Planctomycetaceae bacterium]|nr:UDP-3-O-[3-hydroxymyristoyl] N-acetylglucosamine deacetylase [Planctomycetaceae bacterium]